MSNTEYELSLSDLGTELDGSVCLVDLSFLGGLENHHPSVSDAIH